MGNIELELRAGPVFDLLASLIRLSDDNRKFTNFFEEHNLKANLAIKDWIKKVSNSGNIDNSRLNFYFKLSPFFVRGLFQLAIEANQLSIKGFLELLEGTGPDQLIARLLNWNYQGEKELSSETIKNWSESDDIYSVIETNFKSSQAGKWEIFKLLSNPAQVKAELIDFLNQYYKDIYNEEEDRVQSIVSDFYKEDGAEIEDTIRKGLEQLEGRYEIEGKVVVIITYFLESLDLGFEENTYIIGYRFKEFIDSIILGEDQLNDYIYIFKALADETRLKILLELKDEFLYSNQLAERLDMTNPAISYHMKKFYQAGLIKTKRIENKTYYRINDNKIKDLIKSMEKALL